jgi:16S rRNA (adenine1518-N6/adenine1519-N6)-dimethyltransferase
MRSAIGRGGLVAGGVLLSLACAHSASGAPHPGAGGRPPAMPGGAAFSLPPSAVRFAVAATQRRCAASMAGPAALAVTLALPLRQHGLLRACRGPAAVSMVAGSGGGGGGGRGGGGGGGGRGGGGSGGDAFGMPVRQGPPSADGPRQFKTPSQSGDVYKAKQSLGQNFLVDTGMARKMVGQVEDASDNGQCVVEVGPGKGALSALLLSQYPKMTAIEIDQRSVAYLGQELPDLDIRHQDVLTVDWQELSQEKADGQQLSVIGNLPYYIVSQILFSILDAAPHVRRAVLTMQLEVAQRVVSTPKGKTYGILSVVSQLYGEPHIAFKIPPTVFQPQPDVDSALVVIDFPKERPVLGINECHLRTVLRSAFQMRRKMLRQSLKV